MADIFDHIQDYAPYDEREASDLEKLQAFMAKHEDDGEDMHENLFSRSNLKGHITSSASSSTSNSFIHPCSHTYISCLEN